MMNKQFLMANHKWMNEKYIHGKMDCIWGHKAQLYHYPGRGREGRGEGGRGKGRRGREGEGRGRGDSQTKRTRMLIEKFWKEHPRGDLHSVWWVWLECSSAVRGNIISFHKFWFKTLKDTAIASTVDLFRLNTLTGTKTAFLTPKSTLYMGVP